MFNIGDRIKFIRKEILNLSQDELALELGLKSKMGVSHLELNNVELSVEQLLKLSEMSGKSVEWILTGKERDEQAHCTAKEKKLEAENKQLKLKLASLLGAFEKMNKVKQKVEKENG